MTADTIEANRARRLDPTRDVWLFGYGSLVFKAGFDYIERRPASLKGWARRFWQGSHDHRGTPDAPGRVVTLVRCDDAECIGMAYRVTPAVFDHLDVREKNGYLRLSETIRFTGGGLTEALVYIAREDNEAWLGPAGLADIARHIASSRGPSGPNSEYVLELAAWLRGHGAVDEHVDGVAGHLLALRGDDGVDDRIPETPARDRPTQCHNDG